MINIGILGANGRMGKSLIETVLDDESLALSAAIVPPQHESEGQTVLSSSIIYQSDLQTAFQESDKKSDVMIDFTHPQGTRHFLKLAHEVKMPLVIGTTGLLPEDHALMEKLSQIVPVVYDTNMSVGINILNVLVQKASSLLGEEFDLEILEMHHRYKKDAPSGTALTLGKFAARGRGVDLDDVACFDRNQQGERKTGEIGFASLRGGGVFGDHQVSMTSDEEMILLSHRAITRTVFAKGALRAAKWLLTQPTGLYSMKDVLYQGCPIKI